MVQRFASPRLAGLLLAMACLGLAGCSSAETRRIAREAVSSSIRSACAGAGNCTVDCSEAAQIPQGAKCAEKP